MKKHLALQPNTLSTEEFYQNIFGTQHPFIQEVTTVTRNFFQAPQATPLNPGSENLFFGQNFHNLANPTSNPTATLRAPAQQHFPATPRYAAPINWENPLPLDSEETNLPTNMARQSNKRPKTQESKISHNQNERDYRDRLKGAATAAGELALTLGAQVGFKPGDLGEKTDGTFVKAVGIKALVTVATELASQLEQAKDILSNHPELMAEFQRRFPGHY